MKVLWKPIPQFDVVQCATCKAVLEITAEDVLVGDRKVCEGVVVKDDSHVVCPECGNTIPVHANLFSNGSATGTSCENKQSDR